MRALFPGASSGFGALAARALAQADHNAYTGIWAPDGNINPFEESALASAKQHSVDLRTVELDVLSESSISAAVDIVMESTRAPDRHVHRQLFQADGLRTS